MPWAADGRDCLQIRAITTFFKLAVPDKECSFNLSLCLGLGLTLQTIEIKIKFKNFRNLLLFYARVLITFLVIFHIFK